MIAASAVADDAAGSQGGAGAARVGLAAGDAAPGGLPRRGAGLRARAAAAAAGERRSQARAGGAADGGGAAYDWLRVVAVWRLRRWRCRPCWNCIFESVRERGWRRFGRGRRGAGSAGRGVAFLGRHGPPRCHRRGKRSSSRGGCGEWCARSATDSPHRSATTSAKPGPPADTGPTHTPSKTQFDADNPASAARQRTQLLTHRREEGANFRVPEPSTRHGPRLRRRPRHPRRRPARPPAHRGRPRRRRGRPAGAHPRARRPRGRPARRRGSHPPGGAHRRALLRARAARAPARRSVRRRGDGQRTRPGVGRARRPDRADRGVLCERGGPAPRDRADPRAARPPRRRGRAAVRRATARRLARERRRGAARPRRPGADDPPLQAARLRPRRPRRQRHLGEAAQRSARLRRAERAATCSSAAAPARARRRRSTR